MSSVTNPCSLFATMLGAEWSTTTGGVKPVIDTKWYSKTHSVVTMPDGKNRRIRHVSLKEIDASHEVFGQLIEQVDLEMQIDIWAQTEDDAHEMRDEVKRILRANASSPVTGVSFVTVTAWRDMSDFESEQLYRLTASAFLNYEEA